MNGGTHFAIGALLGSVGILGTAYLSGAPIEPQVVIIGTTMSGIGAWLPDIDHPYATISRKFPRKLFALATQLLSLLLLFGIPSLFLGFFQGKDLPGIWIDLKPSLSSEWILYAVILACIAFGLMLVSAIIPLLCEHRGPTHSIPFTTVVTFVAIVACAWLNVYWWYGLLFGMGCLSHLIADSRTEMGLPALWWPFSEILEDY